MDNYNKLIFKLIYFYFFIFFIFLIIVSGDFFQTSIIIVFIILTNPFFIFQNIYIVQGSILIYAYPIGYIDLFGGVILKQCMDSDNLHRRIKKIIGQLNAIDRMIDEDIPCENILMQVNASKSALHKVGHIIVEGHLEHCIKNAIEAGDSDEAINDVSTILEYYSRL